jgi:TPR repeat protein
VPDFLLFCPGFGRVDFGEIRSKQLVDADAVAQDNLGLLFLQERQGIQKNEPEALKSFQRPAEQGNASAQNHLGYCYAETNGPNQGNADAEFNLGQNYYAGLGMLNVESFPSPSI